MIYQPSNPMLLSPSPGPHFSGPNISRSPSCVSLRSSHRNVICSKNKKKCIGKSLDSNEFFNKKKNALKKDLT